MKVKLTIQRGSYTLYVPYMCSFFVLDISIIFVNFVSSLSRMEELTDPELIRQNVKSDRKVSLYGYVRGAHLQHNSRVHIIGNCHTTDLYDVMQTLPLREQALVDQRVDITVCWIKLYLVDSTVSFVNNYLLDSDLTFG